jgi:DNA repair protein RecO (recombination protein O)
MSHSIYTTEGFILKSVNFGEANKYFYIFTKDFGLIKATAQGVRLLKSKLRYSLEDFSFGTISLVRGRELWRITSAEKKFALNSKETEKFLLVSRVSSLLLRLLQGEENNDLLFQSLKEGILFLQDYYTEDFSNFEYILVLRILSALGYFGKLTEFSQFTSSPYFTSELLLNIQSLKSKVIFEINNSLKETHL